MAIILIDENGTPQRFTEEELVEYMQLTHELVARLRHLNQEIIDQIGTWGHTRVEHEYQTKLDGIIREYEDSV
jgi:hypothetical protein